MIRYSCLVASIREKGVRNVINHLSRTWQDPACSIVAEFDCLIWNGGGTMNRIRVLEILLLATVMLSALSSMPAFASWQINGNPVCTADNDQLVSQVISDGAGPILPGLIS